MTCKYCLKQKQHWLDFCVLVAQFLSCAFHMLKWRHFIWLLSQSAPWYMNFLWLNACHSARGTSGCSSAHCFIQTVSSIQLQLWTETAIPVPKPQTPADQPRTSLSISACTANRSCSPRSLFIAETSGSLKMPRSQSLTPFDNGKLAALTFSAKFDILTWRPVTLFI